MENEDNKTPKEYIKEPDRVRAQVLSRVLGEHDVINAQRVKRVELLKKLESLSGKGQKKRQKIGYTARGAK
ncbi:MAG: hypothetical protein L0229_09690 [Blastocatellia bacterium]|nr:hypothetical protein [Blastocatellia bacterium]